LYFNVKEGKCIPEKNYDAVAKIYSKLKSYEKQTEKNTNNNFNEILVEKLKKEYEVLSIEIPEKIELQLSKTLFALVKEYFYHVTIR